MPADLCDSAAKPASFTFLRPGPGRAAADVLEENFGLGELAARVVIRDEFRRKYRVFAGWAEFWEWRDRVPAGERCFDEVVFGAFPQHLKFDVDAPGSEVDAIGDEDVRAFGGGAPPAAEPVAFDDLWAELLGAEEEAGPAPLVPAGPGEAPAAARQAKVDAVLALLIDTILDELHAAYFGLDEICATRDDLVVFESSGPAGGGWKFSFHVLVAPYAVANNEEAKGFTARVLARLPAAVRGLVDPQVNKSLQNFRLAGSTKPGSAREKRVTTRYGTAAPPRGLTVVKAAPGARVLCRLFTEEVGGGGGPVRLLGQREGPGAGVPDVADEDLRAVLAAAAGAVGGAHEFRQARGGLLLFRRTAPSFCALCGRTHDRDSTLMLALEPVEGGGGGLAPGAKAPHRVVERCRHAGRGAGRVVATATVAFRAPPGEGGAPAGGAAAAARGASLTVGARVAALRAGEADPHAASASGFESLPPARKHVYAEPQMRAYEAAPTLVVRAQMKLGKTRQLREYLDREFPRGGGPGGRALREPVVRFVTFRQTFSKSMQRENFPDFELYSDHAGDLDPVRFPRLIVQVESLHRLPMPPAPEPVDLLVLDEAESILAQFNSGLHRKFNAAFAMFQWMVATAGRVVAMDANVGDRTLRVLETMRAAHPPFFHWNQFRRAADDVFYFTAEQAVWLDHLFERLRAGARVVLPTNSLAEAETFEAAVRDRFPGKAVRLYSSKTPPGEKGAHFADVHAHWSGLDVLIYTPTVSAGVSYELEHFDALFGYFVDTSCDVETCRQMLARVRNIGTKEHFVCLSGRANNLPTDVADIRRLLRDKRSNLFRDLDDAGAQRALQLEYGPDGEPRVHESNYFGLWLETTRVANLSRNGFVARFIDQVADTGAAVRCLEALPGAGGRLVEIKAGHKRLKRGLAEAECEALAAAADLCPEEAARVRDRLGRQEDVPAADRLGLLKYRLADAYRWHGRPMDPAFVAAYQAPQAVRVYKNLLRITAGRTVVDSLRLIQEQEAGNHRALMEARLAPGAPAARDAAENRDLHQRYVFQAHFLAVWLLRLCGFRCITDRALVRAETLFHRIRAGEAEFLAQLEAISFEFQLRRPSVRSLAAETDPRAYVKKALGVVNPVERAMYGVEIRRTRPSVGGKDFYLASTKIGALFDLRAAAPEGEGAKPYVVSRLLPVGGGDDAVLHFLDGRFFEAVAPRLAAEAPGAPAPAGAPPRGHSPCRPPPRPPPPLAPASGAPGGSEEIETIAAFLDQVRACGGGREDAARFCPRRPGF